MRESLIPHLACPQTGAPLTLHGAERRGEEILGGELRAGALRYPIIHGVPCFLTPEQQVQAKSGFADMWRLRREERFERRSVYGIVPERKARWVETRLGGPIQPGELVMDAGCGSAELTGILARRHPESTVVGLDMNETVRQVAADARDQPNLHFVQADIARPPFRRGSFQHVYSLGVLHHTPDTRQAFAGAASLLGPGGRLLIWIYPDARETLALLPLYFVRDVQFLGRGQRLPPQALYRLSRLSALTLMPWIAPGYLAYRWTAALAPGPDDDRVLDEQLSLRELFDTVAFSVYDTVTPTWQHRHRRAEVLGWYGEQGFAVADTDRHGTYWGQRP